MTNNLKLLTLSLSIFTLVTAYLYAPTTSFAASMVPAQAQVRLTDGKLRSCQARETAILTRSNNLTRMATNMLDTFASIAKRVEDYYSTSGKTLTNYSTLVADIQTKKEAVLSALASAQKDVEGFSCTSNDPKGHMDLFLKDMKNVKSALKTYRTSIKNLIVAVRSLNIKDTVSPSPSASPSPSVSADPSSLRTPNPRSNNQGKNQNK